MGRENNRGITLIALVITIIVLLILAGISISSVVGESGIISKAYEAKTLIAVKNLKEEINLDNEASYIEGKKITPETLLAEGKVKRTIQQANNGNYYMYYILKEDAYSSMKGLGKGNNLTLKDVFLIDDNLNIKYIDNKGKEFGDNIDNKILEDDTKIRFSNKVFEKYISKISGVSEEKMKFKWMKNQTKLTIADKSITSLEDLVFFPNLIELTIGDWQNTPEITELDGIENCTKMQSVKILFGPDKDYSKLALLSNLKKFYRRGANDYKNIIQNLKKCSNIEEISILNQNIENTIDLRNFDKLKTLCLDSNNLIKVPEINNITSLETISLANNRINKIENLNNLVNLKKLNLQNNNIKDITPLQYNNSLMELNLKENINIDGNRKNYSKKEQDALNKIGEILDRDGIINIDIDKIGLFTNYKQLDLSNQNLTSLEKIEGLINLRTLNLSNNQLTLEDVKSQEILTSMKDLEELDLKSNKITNIKVINNLKKLKRLNLFGNENYINIAEIEDIFSNLESFKCTTENLKTITNCDETKIININMNNSALTELPDLKKFINIKKIDFSNNPKINNFSVLSNLYNLEQLNLINNDLHGRMIDFSKLNNLTRLDLSRNMLWSEDLENLKTLSNNKNLIINLDNNSIINTDALLVLDPSCKIYLRNNINLSLESKEKLKSKFGNNVLF